MTRLLSQLSLLACSKAFRLPFGLLVKREEAVRGWVPQRRLFSRVAGLREP